MKKLILILLAVSLLSFSKVGSVSAQTCTVTPPTNTGIVTLSADTTVATGQTSATYRVWSRMKAASSTNNSFYLQIDSTCPVLVQTTSTSFIWVSNPSNVTLTAGTHVIKVIGNQPGVGVDKILMTKNLTCIPDNTIPPAPNNFAGLNCPAEVIASPTVGPTDNTPPTISGVTTTSLTSTSVDIEWTLSEGGTGQVDYGKTTSYELGPTTLESNFLTFHRQSITGLTSGTLYHYRIRSADAKGNLATSNDFTFTTTGGLTPTPTVTPSPSPTLTPTKTPTPTITPTPIPNSTVLKFNSVKLHGIGTGGDNTSPTLTGNMTPLKTTRTLTVELIDSNGNSLPISTGNIIYKSASGDFSGDITLDPSIPDGPYLVKVKSTGYLKRQLAGIITITKSVVNTVPTTSNPVLITGDINNDNALSILDYNVIVDCYSDLLAPKNCSDPNKKDSADISDDGNVNANDYNLFLRELSVVSGN